MKKFPKNIKEAENYSILVIDNLSIKLNDLINYCNYLFKPGEFYCDEERVKRHALLFSQCGKDRLDEKIKADYPDGILPNGDSYEGGSPFNDKLETIICNCFCCPIHHLSLNRDYECFECNFKLQTLKDLFNNIIINNLNLLKKYEKFPKNRSRKINL